MNKDLKDFFDRKKSEYLVNIEKWDKLYIENMDKAQQADKERKNFKNLLKELEEDEKFYGNNNKK